MGRPLPIALAQVPGRTVDDVAGFAESAATIIASHPETRLLVYPELHLSMDESGAAADELLDQAQPLRSGPRHEMLSEVAADLGIWLCPGSVYELGADDHVYNTAIVYGPSGELAATYRKVFPWRPFERTHAGREFVVFDLPGVTRIGLSICYDAWFPECTRHLAWMGAELVLNVVRTATVDRTQEIVLARANATVNQVFVASVNAAAPSGRGQSVLVGPEGNVLGETVDSAAAVLTSVIDLDLVSNARRYGSFGMTRMWDQMQDEDPPIPMPLYGGEITAKTWGG